LVKSLPCEKDIGLYYVCNEATYGARQRIGKPFAITGVRSRTQRDGSVA
jgi:hypothetical protein